MTLLHNYGVVSIQEIEGKGRGIVAERAIRRGEAITVQPVLVMPASDYLQVERTLLADYIFHWPYNEDGSKNPDSDLFAVGLGITSLFNTSESPNANWRFNPLRRMQTIYATRRIRAGEEISVNYNWPEGQLKETKDEA